jgi:hypothetical protein
MVNTSFSERVMGNPCTGNEGYADIGEGSPVTVYNAAAQIVAIGALGKGRTLDAAGWSCLFPFEVAGIPSDSKFYQVEVLAPRQGDVQPRRRRAGQGDVVDARHLTRSGGSVASVTVSHAPP